MFAMIRNEIPINGSGTPAVLVGKDWFRFFASLFTLTTSGSRDAVIPFTGVSPLVYTALAKGQAIVSGGTVSAIELSRDNGTTYYTTGLTAGVFPMSANDLVRVTYSVAPTTLVFVPL